MRLQGLRCDVVAKDDIHYVLFYDIDRTELTDDDITFIDSTLKTYGISYLLYKTKHGYHLIGLTPLTHQQWSSIFTIMKSRFHSYYGGIIIRLSRKPEEKQVLIKLEESYGEVIPNLFNVFASRFELQKKFWKRELAKYLLVFEVYRTEKI